jgi:hypothetical protein
MRALPAGFALHPRIRPVVVTAEYYIGIEDIDGMAFAHASVFTAWTPRVARAMRADFDVTVARYGPPLYGIALDPHRGDHAKFDRWVMRMGFVYHSIECVRGSFCVCWVRWS